MGCEISAVIGKVWLGAITNYNENRLEEELLFCKYNYKRDCRTHLFMCLIVHNDITVSVNNYDIFISHSCVEKRN